MSQDKDAVRRRGRARARRREDASEPFTGDRADDSGGRAHEIRVRARLTSDEASDTVRAVDETLDRGTG